MPRQPRFPAMHIENWEKFYQRAEALYKADPLNTRYSLKYRNCDGRLHIKVTDNTTVRGRGVTVSVRWW